MKSIGKTYPRYLNRVDIEKMLSIGSTQAAVVINTIADVCGYIRIGRSKAIRSQCFYWYMDSFGIVVDWDTYQLEHAEEAREQFKEVQFVDMW